MMLNTYTKQQTAGARLPLGIQGSARAENNPTTLPQPYKRQYLPAKLKYVKTKNMKNPNLLNLLLLLLLFQTATVSQAQDTTSYVRPWPLESLQMPDQVRMQTTEKQGIPRDLQNHTFADTIVDT